VRVPPGGLSTDQLLAHPMCYSASTATPIETQGILIHFVLLRWTANSVLSFCSTANSTRSASPDCQLSRERLFALDLRLRVLLTVRSPSGRSLTSREPIAAQLPTPIALRRLTHRRRSPLSARLRCLSTLFSCFVVVLSCSAAVPLLSVHCPAARHPAAPRPVARHAVSAHSTFVGSTTPPSWRCKHCLLAILFKFVRELAVIEERFIA